MKLRSGNEIGKNKEQMLEAKNKEGDSEPVSLKTKVVKNAYSTGTCCPKSRSPTIVHYLCCIR